MGLASWRDHFGDREGAMLSTRRAMGSWEVLSWTKATLEWMERRWQSLRAVLEALVRETGIDVSLKPVR